MPAPRAVQNLQMPHPRDWQGGQMPRSNPGGGGVGWAQVELTDIFARNLFIFAVYYRNSCFTNKCSTCITNEYFMSNVKIVKIL